MTRHHWSTVESPRLRCWATLGNLLRVTGWDNA